MVGVAIWGNECVKLVILIQNDWENKYQAKEQQ